MMKYKNYIGSEEISREDNILHGKLLHIKDLVTYEAESPKALEDAFREAVDYYIADCKADGIDPDVPFKGSFNVRVSPETHRSLAVSAIHKGCKLNKYVASILEDHENNKDSPYSTMHYHFNLEVRHQEKLLSKEVGFSKVNESNSFSYMEPFVSPIAKSKELQRKAELCH